MENQPDIAAQLALMTRHPDLFTKEQMAAMMEKAVNEIEELRSLLRVHEAAEMIAKAGIEA